MKSDSPQGGKGAILAVHWILLASVGIAIAVSGYKYLFAQDYHFLVEAPCDPSTYTCYVRDCAEEECPPNELSFYRIFSIPAKTFSTCSDNTCMNICILQDKSCEEILCSPDAETSCNGPLSSL